MGEASLNDLLDRHTDYLCGWLTKAVYNVAKESHSLGLKVLPLPVIGYPVDTRFLEVMLSYKHAGQAAGLGKIGWHNLLIAPDFGPRVRLSSRLVEAELEPTTTNTTIECDSRSICLDNCHTEALATPQASEKYAINKFACSAFRSASGGCCQCMQVCPVGR